MMAPARRASQPTKYERHPLFLIGSKIMAWGPSLIDYHSRVRRGAHAAQETRLWCDRRSRNVTAEGLPKPDLGVDYVGRWNLRGDDSLLSDDFTRRSPEPRGLEGGAWGAVPP